jgi:dolichol-phosphate mannosyltransferase
MNNADNISDEQARMVDISIIIPAYNEAGNIASAVKTTAEAGRRLARPFEIVAVNDGSADGTGKLLAELKADCPQLQVVTHERNRGLGAAIRTGIRAARGKFCILLPADSPYDAETLRPFLTAADDADVVLGYRAVKPGYSWFMRFNSRLYHWLLRTICGLPYRDVNWVHLYRRRIFEQIDLEFAGIVMEAEVVLKAHMLGLRIREVASPMQERTHGRASAARPKVMVRTGWDLLRLLWRWLSGDLRRKLGEGLLTDEKSRDEKRCV